MNEHRHVRGFQFNNLLEYIQSVQGPEAVTKVRETCGIDSAFDPHEFYEDDLFNKLIKEGAKELEMDQTAFEIEIGRRAVPTLRKLFPQEFEFSSPAEFIANFPNAYQRFANSENPFISFVPKGASSCRIHYYSASKLCGLAQGIIAGSFTYYDVEVDIRSKKCQKHGDPECIFEITWHAKT